MELCNFAPQENLAEKAWRKGERFFVHATFLYRVIHKRQYAKITIHAVLRSFSDTHENGLRRYDNVIDAHAFVVKRRIVSL